MWCGVLGPLVVRDDAGEDIAISGPARRLLLAALLGRAGRTVSADVLIEDIWGALPPRSAAKTLQSHVVRLRDDLGRTGAGERLVTDRLGYRLDVDADDVDARCFETHVATAIAMSDDAAAAASIDAALALWRGDAYEEFTEAAFTVPERIRLAELRLLAEEHRADRALNLGESASLVSGLEKRVAEAPYRERSWEQLIIALYRSGRQADALGAYRRARERLGEDLGVEPGPALRDLETRVLRQDPDLLVRPPQVIPAARPDANRCPYLGLASYSDADSDLFVGRERLTSELVGRVADHRVVVVAGASGTGKSSVLRAGLIPALRAGALPGSTSWRSAVRTPNDDLRAAVSTGLDLLVVDQAEELFTVLDAQPRASAVELLEQFVESGGRLVLALRGEFYGRLAEVQPFGAYAQAATVLVGALRADDVRRVVVEPAQHVGLACDGDFVEAVMDDVAGQPAALPLLSSALVRTWENRTEGRMTLDGYRAGGGFATAIEATAERAYAELDPDQRVAARRLLVRLAELDGDQWVRRPLRRADLDADPSAAAVAARLADARLVTLAPGRVELTHDALLVHWPRLRTWLAERARAADLLDHLGTAARAWQESGQTASDVYRGVRLQTALDWQAEHPDDVSETERAFLAASAAAADVELHEARERAEHEARGRRRLRAVAMSLAAVLIVAIAITVVAFHERSSARTSATSARQSALVADARRLAALSLDAPDIETSSLLSVAAFRLQDNSDTRSALLAAVERNEAALWRLPWPHRMLRLYSTPDGSRLTTWDNHRDIVVVDVAKRRAVASFTVNGQGVVGITADGTQVLVSGDGPLESDSQLGRICLTDVATGRCAQVITRDADPNAPEPTSSYDSRWLVDITTKHRGAGVVVDVFDAHDWKAAPRSFVVAANPQALSVGTATVAVQNADGSIDVRSLTTLREIRHIAGVGHVDPEGALTAVSPDDSAVATADPDNPTRVLLEHVTGTSAAVPLPAQASGTSRFAFSRDGREIAVAAADGTINVYATADGAPRETLAGETGAVTGMVWTPGSPEGLYSVGLDSQLVSWSTATTSRLAVQSGADIPVVDRGEIFGRYVFGITPDQNSAPSSQWQAYDVNLDTGVRSQWPLHLPDNVYINQAVLSWDGKRALISLQRGDGSLSWVEIWDVARRAKVGQLDLPGDTAKFPIGLNAAISPDGRTAYSSLSAKRIGVFDLPSGRYLRSFDITFADPDSVRIAAVPWLFTPDGHLLFGAFDPGHLPDSRYGVGPGDTLPPNQRLGLVDVHTGRLVAQVGLGDVRFPTGVAWSVDGSLFAVGTYDGTLTLYDAHTLQLRTTAGAAEPGTILSIAFAPDGRSLVTSGSAGLVDVWSVPNLSREGGRLQIGDANRTLAWYDRGGRIVGLAPDRTNPSAGMRWFTFPAQPAELISAACGLAGTDMTPDQWQRYVGNRPYEHVCPTH